MYHRIDKGCGDNEKKATNDCGFQGPTSLHPTEVLVWEHLDARNSYNLSQT